MGFRVGAFVIRWGAIPYHMNSSRKHSGDFVACANPACGRKLEAANYITDSVGAAPVDRVHREFRPNERAGAFLCTCGHYTVHHRG